jgi:hypothetical protein
MNTKGEPQRLDVDLRFRPNSDALQWRRVFAGLVEWEPLLKPIAWLDATDPDQVRYPWSEQAAAELFALCAAHTPMVRVVEAGSDGTGAITVRVRKSEVVMLVALPRPTEPLHRYSLKLLECLRTAHQPAIGMLFDLDSKHDAEVIFQGLRGLYQVPPYLFFDSAAVDAVGRDRIESAPCIVLEAPGGGVLLVSRPDPWARRIGDELWRARAVEQHLGVSKRTPLILARL